MCIRDRSKGEQLSDEEKRVAAAVERMHEQNPMLGLRGVRLGLVIEGLFEMQAKALLEAAAELKVQGKNPVPEIMIPLIGSVQELEIMKEAIPVSYTHLDVYKRQPLLVLFDHEEVGSTTNRGADSQFLPAVWERIVRAGGGDRDAALRAFAGSLVCSADMAHAVHPNYAERSEPHHQVRLGEGPAVKVNSKARYASDATGIAAVRLAAERAGVGLQAFVTRGDLPCGSTIGPMTAALTGAVTVDVGAPMLSMHSARELTGVADVADYRALLTAFLAPA